MVKKVLLLNGIFGVIIYCIAVITGGFIVPGYSHIVHTVSDLQKESLQGGTVLSVLFVCSAFMFLVFAIVMIL